MSGRVTVIGLGPGEPHWLTPEADAALAVADALYGYAPYVARIPERAGQERHSSDNREEGARAAAALRHAAGPASISAHTAAAMANTPGSPPDTIATCAPTAAWRRAAAARAPSSRLSDEWRS